MEVEQYVNEIVTRIKENTVPLLDEEEIERVARVIFSSKLTEAYEQGILDRNRQQLKRVLDQARTLKDAAIRQLPEAECWTIETHVFASSNLHAFSCGAGRMAITEGLATMMTDHEICAILAHEFAHSILQHALKMTSVDQCVATELDSVPLPIREKVRSSVERTLTQPLRHQFEQEADALSLQLLADSGIDPTAALTVMRKLADLEQQPGIKQQFSVDVDHPSPAHRLARMEKALPEAALAYQAHCEKNK